ncbi:cytochrome P450 1A5-like [Orcinus orca]|uniref:cytochrome P450 1A5-like n=1 Tax=Orcinus orca TaxID=9733 RepID=UPI002111EC7E|nr:cytochrome P450 1A5-like [Orcinus orca]
MRYKAIVKEEQTKGSYGCTQLSRKPSLLLDPSARFLALTARFLDTEFETISTCLYWSFLYLIHYPEIQAKIQEEIDGNIGMKSTRFGDRKILPSTEAFINEIFRHASFLPVTVLHCEGGGMSLTPCGNRQSRMQCLSPGISKGQTTS